MSKANPETKDSDGIAEKVSLAKMRMGETGRIVQIEGGHDLFGKLSSLGIREGEKITKVSGQWMRGPVLLKHGNTQVALGFGMARRVLVQLSGKPSEK